MAPCRREGLNLSLLGPARTSRLVKSPFPLMNRHDLLIKIRSTFPVPASLCAGSGAVSYACWSCSFVKGKCSNLPDLPLGCLLWQSQDRKKWPKCFRQKSGVPGRIQVKDSRVLYSREGRKITHFSAPAPKAKPSLYAHKDFINPQVPSSDNLLQNSYQSFRVGTKNLLKYLLTSLWPGCHAQITWSKISIYDGTWKQSWSLSIKHKISRSPY